MTDRCEPPEHLRGVDGWHVLASPSPHGYERPWFWVPASDEGQAHWNNLGCPEQAHHNGYRYLAPVTPPSTVAALVEALTECADDLEAEVAERYRATRHHPSERRREERDMAPVLAARAALALYRGEVA